MTEKGKRLVGDELLWVEAAFDVVYRNYQDTMQNVRALIIRLMDAFPQDRELRQTLYQVDMDTFAARAYLDLLRELIQRRKEKGGVS